ncbi:MAG TPA: GNAT family N-acetyltransferase [Gammaproteobacteria bacterium]|nr:GNAT family N-acetyltransferase [Gammaproteobacteria bacterium]
MPELDVADVAGARSAIGEICLVALDRADLQQLANSDYAAFGEAPEGAMPPPHVAMRALAGLEAGTPALWCVPFLIVQEFSRIVVGGCGFKAAPVDGSAEIGYGVAEAYRCRGIASAAVTRLLEMATESGSVDEVVATILPGNIASSKVVSRLGFTAGPSFVDTNGEVLVRWSYRVAT